MASALALLFVAIGIEVAATASLPRTEGFTELWWSVAVLCGYGASIWLLAIVVRTLPVSVTYAVWSGLGTAIVAVIGYMLLGEEMSWLKAVSLGMIVVGVIGVNLAGAH